ncbi:MAG TPA: Gfo/Idh/MocA family oxidoreductase [Verrucomicrobiae bacterium]
MKPQPRRRFIKSTAAALAVAPFISIEASAQETGQRKLGFALCGLGSLSTNQIAPALQKAKYCRLAGIITGTPEKARAWKAKYKIPDKNIYNYETMAQMADNPDIDVVYVVTPNALHAEHTIKSAKAGKHVLSEKPMEVSVKKCQNMIDACKKAGRKLAIAYRCQFEAHHLECMRIAREKELGAIKIIEAGFGFRISDPKQWRLRHNLAGGGALMDVGIYALQATRFLTGEEPTILSAFETKTDPVKFKEVDESIVWQMKFPGGAIAYCSTSYAVNGINRYTAYADKGWFGLDPAYSYDGLQGHRSDKKPIKFDEVDQFALEMDDFAQCILNNRESKVSGEEGLRDIRILMGVYDSIKSGKPVKLV